MLRNRMLLILTIAESGVGVQTDTHSRHALEEPPAVPAPMMTKAEEMMLPWYPTKQFVGPVGSAASTATNLRKFAFCDWRKQVRTSPRKRVSSVAALNLERSFLSLHARSSS